MLKTGSIERSSTTIIWRLLLEDAVCMHSNLASTFVMIGGATKSTN